MRRRLSTGRGNCRLARWKSPGRISPAGRPPLYLDAAIDRLQAPIPHITVYYICIHKLISCVTLLLLITPQLPIDSEFIREQSHFIAISPSLIILCPTFVRPITYTYVSLNERYSDPVRESTLKLLADPSRWWCGGSIDRWKFPATTTLPRFRGDRDDWNPRLTRERDSCTCREYVLTHLRWQPVRGP